MNITDINIKNLIIQKAKELGFEKVGFARYEVLEKEFEQLKLWINKGYDADMVWIERGIEKRRDVSNILPGAKSVISLAYNYYTPIEHDETKPKVSRYAWGKDYHKVLKKKLKELISYCDEHSEAIPPDKEVASSLGSLQFKAYVDDGPVMDKAWAVKAGIGWQGKHTNVINPEFGSWFFICSIITNIEFDNYDSPVTDQCGSCTLCISACPTGAITDEYIVDSNKCISYQTIENRGEIPHDISLNGWIFGCDICQDVCPYNSPKYNRVTNDESFYPKDELKTSSYPFFSEGQFNTIFADSPIKRTKYTGWKRNLEKA